MAARAPTIAVAAAVAVAFADSSVVVLALPELYVRLHTSILGVSWVITAYNLAVAVGALVLVPLVRCRRPPWLPFAGLGLFLTASVGCGVSTGLAQLVAFRAAQGAGAALLLVASLPLLASLAGSAERGLAIWATAGALGTALGPALGGVLTQAFGWRAIFVAQAPVAAAALLATLDPRARRELIHLLRDLPQTMIVSTHDIPLVRDLLPRTVVMDGGVIVADGETRALLSDSALLAAHGLDVY